MAERRIPAEIVVIILDRLGFSYRGLRGESWSFRHPEYVRRLLLFMEPEVGEWNVIDALESVHYPLSRYYAVRDAVLAEQKPS